MEVPLTTLRYFSIFTGTGEVGWFFFDNKQLQATQEESIELDIARQAEHHPYHPISNRDHANDLHTLFTNKPGTTT